ncbi:MAG: hypothetical protein R3F60_17375 [bacterium]
MSDVEYWAERIMDTGRRIARLLATDARTFFEDTVRERFVETPRSPTPWTGPAWQR